MSDDEWGAAQALRKVGPQPGEFYQHYKGELYLVTHRTVDEETLQQIVVYQKEGESACRTLENFVSGVSVAGIVKARFRRIGNHQMAEGAVREFTDQKVSREG